MQSTVLGLSDGLASLEVKVLASSSLCKRRFSPNLCKRQAHWEGLLTLYYNNSPIAAVVEIFNNHKWEKWKFKNITHGFSSVVIIFPKFTRDILELPLFPCVTVESFNHCCNWRVIVVFTQQSPPLNVVMILGKFDTNHPLR
jgi:hypothetical protein